MVADRPLRPHHRVVGQLDLVDPAAYAVLAGAIGGDRPPLAGGGVDDADLAAAVGKPASVGDQVAALGERGHQVAHDRRHRAATVRKQHHVLGLRPGHHVHALRAGSQAARVDDLRAVQRSHRAALDPALVQRSGAGLDVDRRPHDVAAADRHVRQGATVLDHRDRLHRQRPAAGCQRRLCRLAAGVGGGGGDDHLRGRLARTGALGRGVGAADASGEREQQCRQQQGAQAPPHAGASSDCDLATRAAGGTSSGVSISAHVPAATALTRASTSSQMRLKMSS